MDNDYWYLGYKREYPEGYDENGFAQGARLDPFAHALASVMTRETTPPVKIRKDYTEDFLRLLTMKHPILADVKVMTLDPSLSAVRRHITFDATMKISGARYVYRENMSILLVNTQAEFDYNHWIVLSGLAVMLKRKVQELCTHEWTRPVVKIGERMLTAPYLECALCGQQQLPT